MGTKHFVAPNILLPQATAPCADMTEQDVQNKTMYSYIFNIVGN